MTSKHCNKCDTLKPIEDFGGHISNPDRHQNWCKKCQRDRTKVHRKTKNGLASGIYSHQRSHSRSRGHCLPSYTLQEFSEWLFSHPKFNNLYNKWVQSGYKRDLYPSPDRLDDYKPYSLDNLQLVTWVENRKRSHKDAIEGINKKQNTEVAQLGLNGGLIEVFHSMSQAARVNNMSHSSISTCCSGKRQSVGGYKWMKTIASGVIKS